jgi:magnesium chelatase family protein
MALFRTYSAALHAIDAHLIDVEVDMYPAGTNRDFVTVGMPDAAVRESRERIKSALLNSGFGYPNKSVTINLALPTCGKKGPDLISRWRPRSWEPWVPSARRMIIC